MYAPIQRKEFIQVSALISLVILLIAACSKQPDARASTYLEQSELASRSAVPSNQLEKLLSEANWQAIEEAKRIGKAALPSVRLSLKNNTEQVRRIAMGCAGAIGDPDGADILAAGLRDESFGVQLAAARELADKRYPAAAETVLEVLNKKPADVLAEMLAQAAGFFPGENTIAALRPLAIGDGVLAENANLALAKLGDAAARKALSAKLSAKLPRTRYQALEGLCYVNDSSFAAMAKKSLSDKANALPIGLITDPQNRRVADQAVDSLVCLLKLRPPFETSSTKIYTDREIAVIRDLVKALP